jgi:hypothetical protein
VDGEEIMQDPWCLPTAEQDPGCIYKNKL